ncbi:unnamed protein product [Paramecium sonneborni]|uniref:Transmembrane protein n=1 Tax=Paramecium sonneborni TaxID=65129 RepID=A0A8S1MNW2_9CILI|nr:unnamed protein product [Paramecium sonneborni]
MKYIQKLNPVRIQCSHCKIIILINILNQKKGNNKNSLKRILGTLSQKWIENNINMIDCSMIKKCFKLLDALSYEIVHIQQVINLIKKSSQEMKIMYLYVYLILLSEIIEKHLFFFFFLQKIILISFELMMPNQRSLLGKI